jgi:hypothetical protein
LRFLLPILLLFAATGSVAQDINLVQFEDGDTIRAKDLVGTWIAPGTTYSKALIRYKGGELALVIGKEFKYVFLGIDSLLVNPVKGTRIKWPPDDCELRLINPVLLEIAYTNFQGKTLIYRYRKIR